MSSTDPDTGKTTFTHDAASRLLTTTDARNRVVRYTYDRCAVNDRPHPPPVPVPPHPVDNSRPNTSSTATRHPTGGC
ncbi:hypothetical protein [Amycolatopsis sp. WQ 127309]|uniref:hypothetical protein n=1 Tax=Amycolatopsis sp. WQ 127309 TaxID=2932773 RepID=UPI0035303B90